MKILFGDGLLSLCAVLAMACVIAYQVTTGGAWRGSSTGRHLMAFMGAMAAITLLGTVKVIAIDLFHQHDPEWFQWLRIATFALEPVVLFWRLLIILSASRESRALVPGGEAR